MTQVKKGLQQRNQKLDSVWVIVDGTQLRSTKQLDTEKFLIHEQDGLRIAVPVEKYLVTQGLIMDFGNQNGVDSFFIRNLEPNEVQRPAK